MPEDRAKLLQAPKNLTDKFQLIYKKYCVYKQFSSVMPIFESEYTDSNNYVIGYFDENTLVAFSLLRKYDNENVEAIQFAWDYNKPKLRLGIESLKHECAFLKRLGYKHFYLGYSDKYKNIIDGHEILGPL